MIWCEHCRDHYDEDHYTEDGMAHKVGIEYGPAGRDIVIRRAAKAAVLSYPFPAEGAPRSDIDWYMAELKKALDS